MEELALGAQTLHHVDALAAEEAHVAAADVDGELFPEGTLWEHQTPSVRRGFDRSRRWAGPRSGSSGIKTS